MWRELVTFFPAAVPFRAESSECLECRGESANERKAEEAVKKRREEEIALPVLKALYSRKTGVRRAFRFRRKRRRNTVAEMGGGCPEVLSGLTDCSLRFGFCVAVQAKAGCGGDDLEARSCARSSYFRGVGYATRL